MVHTEGLSLQSVNSHFVPEGLKIPVLGHLNVPPVQLKRQYKRINLIPDPFDDLEHKQRFTNPSDISYDSLRKYGAKFEDWESIQPFFETAANLIINYLQQYFPHTLPADHFIAVANMNWETSSGYPWCCDKKTYMGKFPEENFAAFYNYICENPHVYDVIYSSMSKEEPRAIDKEVRQLCATEINLQYVNARLFHNFHASYMGMHSHPGFCIGMPVHQGYLPRKYLQLRKPTNLPSDVQVHLVDADGKSFDGTFVQEEIFELLKFIRLSVIDYGDDPGFENAANFVYRNNCFSYILTAMRLLLRKNGGQDSGDYKTTVDNDLTNKMYWLYMYLKHGFAPTAELFTYFFTYSDDSAGWLPVCTRPECFCVNIFNTTQAYKVGLLPEPAIIEVYPRDNIWDLEFLGKKLKPIKIGLSTYMVPVPTYTYKLFCSLMWTRGESHLDFYSKLAMMRRLWFLSDEIVPDGRNAGRKIIDVIEDTIAEYRAAMPKNVSQTLPPRLYPIASEIVRYWTGLESNVHLQGNHPGSAETLQGVMIMERSEQKREMKSMARSKKKNVAKRVRPQPRKAQNVPKRKPTTKAKKTTKKLARKAAPLTLGSSGGDMELLCMQLQNPAFATQMGRTVGVPDNFSASGVKSHVFSTQSIFKVTPNSDGKWFLAATPHYLHHVLSSGHSEVQGGFTTTNELKGGRSFVVTGTPGGSRARNSDLTSQKASFALDSTAVPSTPVVGSVASNPGSKATFPMSMTNLDFSVLMTTQKKGVLNPQFVFQTVGGPLNMGASPVSVHCAFSGNFSVGATAASKAFAAVFAGSNVDIDPGTDTCVAVAVPGATGSFQYDSGISGPFTIPGGTKILYFVFGRVIGAPDQDLLNFSLQIAPTNSSVTSTSLYASSTAFSQKAGPIYETWTSARCAGLGVLVQDDTKLADLGGRMAGLLANAGTDAASVHAWTYEEIAKQPGAYQGPSTKGAYGRWSPQSNISLKTWQDLSAPSQSVPSSNILVFAGEGAAPDVFLTVVVTAIWQVQTLDRAFNPTSKSYCPTGMDDDEVYQLATSFLASTPSVTCNPGHEFFTKLAIKVGNAFQTVVKRLPGDLMTVGNAALAAAKVAALVSPMLLAL